MEFADQPTEGVPRAFFVWLQRGGRADSNNFSAGSAWTGAIDGKRQILRFWTKAFTRQVDISTVNGFRGPCRFRRPLLGEMQ
ncbi:MAG TPA: hypothetical protein VNL70_06950 [Tepidisphaeraceae bacterium]|nr:hypothetical protein [Tepidisphaeraceae bacterium]